MDGLCEFELSLGLQGHLRDLGEIGEEIVGYFRGDNSLIATNVHCGTTV